MEWNKKNTLFFIQLIRERPVIWDASSTNHKDKLKKLDALLEIAKILGITKEQVNAKWISLRGQYNREKKKITGLEMGSEAANSYFSKWFAYQEMSRLMSFNISQDSVSNFEYNPKSEQTDVELTMPTLEIEQINLPAPPPPTTSPTTTTMSTPPNFNRNYSLFSEGISYKATQDRKSKTPELDDEITAYGLYVAAQMRKLQPILQSKLKLDIQTLLCKYEIENIENMCKSVSECDVHRQSH